MFKQDGQQGRRRIETRGGTDRTPWGRSPVQWILANGKTPPALPTSENLDRYVEDFDESRTPLAACFNILRLSHMGQDPQPRLSQIPPVGSRNYRIVHKPDLPPDHNSYGSNETGHAERALAG